MEIDEKLQTNHLLLSSDMHNMNQKKKEKMEKMMIEEKKVEMECRSLLEVNLSMRFSLEGECRLKI
jgi:hypothetical protein